MSRSPRPNPGRPHTGNIACGVSPADANSLNSILHSGKKAGERVQTCLFLGSLAFALGKKESNLS